MATPGTNANAKEFLLPDLGEGLEEAELLEWCVQEGQTVEEFDTLAKMETAKALVEVPAPRAGKIQKLHGKAGDIIKVGSPLVTWGEGESDDDAAHADNGTATQVKPDERRAETHVEQDLETRRQFDEVPEELQRAQATTNDEQIEVEGPRKDAGTVVGQLTELGGVSAEPGKVLAAPAVRRLARDLGVELSRLHGSGIGGRITAADVKAATSDNGRNRAAGIVTHIDRPRVAAPGGGTAIERPRPARQPPAQQLAPMSTALPEPQAPPFAVGGSDESITIPFRGVRRTIANRLRESVDRAVHFGVMDEADVTALDGLRKRLSAASGEKLSLLPFVCCAVARTLAGEFGYQLNRLNSTTDDEKGEIIQYRAVNLGIATDTPAGLMVPVIRNATSLGVLEMGRKISQLAAAARDRSIPASDLQGSTFTISNFGSYAGRFASPIINYPEAAILAVGRMREGVVVHNGMMGVGKLLPLSLVSDHRVIDGGTATLFLNKIVELMQNPDVLLPTNLGI